MNMDLLGVDPDGKNAWLLDGKNAWEIDGLKFELGSGWDGTHGTILIDSRTIMNFSLNVELSSPSSFFGRLTYG